jgi:VWFA-related protein
MAIIPLALLAPSVCAQTQQQGEKKIEEEKPKPQGRAGLRVEVNQVRVDVTVQDEKGNLIQGLRKENFKIYEDKVEQEIANFTPMEAPMTAVLVTEFSNAVPSWEFLYDVLMASYNFVEHIRRDDWVAVVAYDIKPEILVDFTQDKSQVYDALRRLSIPTFSESNLYDTMFDVLDRIEELDGKVAVVLVSQGIDTFSKKTLGETLKRVENTGAVIYCVSTGGNLRARYEAQMPATMRMDYYQADSTLKQFAKSTGGVAYFPRFEGEYQGIFNEISARVRHQYSLAYVPTNTAKDGKLRKIRVEVLADVNGDGKPDKLKAFHREGYRVEKEK